MTLWRILRCYIGNQMYYDVLSYELKDYVDKHGLRWVKDTYLSHSKARRIANKRNRSLWHGFN